MARCAYCGTPILFGGRAHEGALFCNAGCERRGALSWLASQIPLADVERYIVQVHRGRCPRCHGRGPVDVHTSHRAWSALFVTRTVNRPTLCCRRCGLRQRLADLAFTLAFGWWGLPWGPVAVLMQAGRTLSGLARPPDPARPSEDLERLLRLRLATSVAASEFEPSLMPG